MDGTNLALVDFGFVKGFGASGLLVAIAWYFWEKSPRMAKVALGAGLVAAILLAVLQVHAAKPPTLTLDIDPDPAIYRWAAFHLDGKVPAKVTATILKNGEASDIQTVIQGFPLDDRDLGLANGENGKINVTWKSYVQGEITPQDLQNVGYRLLSDSQISSALWWVTTQPAVLNTPVAVRSESIHSKNVEPLRLKVVEWLYKEDGAIISVFTEDQIHIGSGWVTREGSTRELTLTYDKKRYGVRILSLNFLTSQAEGGARATFLIGRY